MSSKVSASLKEALKEIEKEVGPDLIMRLGDKPTVHDVVPTGIPALDAALGTGGLVRGQIVEIFGPESSGKSTIAQHVVASAQKLGGTCAYIDMEHSLDPTYAATIGVNIDDLLLSQPECAEQALEIAHKLAESGEVAVIVIDSIAALVPRAEIEGDIGDAHMGLQARLMAQSMRRIKPVLDNTGTILFMINQLRMQVGVFFGNPETTPGGRAVRFYAALRLDIRRTGAIKNKDEISGATTKVKVVKNKFAPPFKVCEFEIMYGEGVSVVGSLLDQALASGVVTMSGTWFNFGDVKLGQGREKAKQFLKDNPAVAEEIAKAL